jgi:hypothetical protein
MNRLKGCDVLRQLVFLPCLRSRFTFASLIRCEIFWRSLVTRVILHMPSGPNVTADINSVNEFATIVPYHSSAMTYPDGCSPLHPGQIRSDDFIPYAPTAPKRSAIIGPRGVRLR